MAAPEQGAFPSANEPGGMQISVSVQELMRRLQGAGEVPASTVALALQDLHPEYGGGDWPNLYEKGTPTRYTIERWIDSISGLQRPEAAVRLHGRLVLVGLAVLDPDLAPFLAAGGFLRRVEQEIKEPLESLLSPEAFQRWHSAAEREPAEPQTVAESDAAGPVPDSVPTHSDHPAREDDLGRAAFARALARRLERVRRDSGWPDLGEPPSWPVWLWFLRERLERGWRTWWGRNQEADAPYGPGGFMLHLNGPWGSGKSSLLNFIADELTSAERPEPWLAVYFNAWRCERLGPPWWALTREVYRQTRSQLQALATRRRDSRQPGDSRRTAGRRAAAVWYSEVWWRALTGIGTPVLVVGLIVLALAALGDIDTMSGQLKRINDLAGIVGGTIAAIGAILTALRFLVTGSARGANALLEMSSDPLNPLIVKFEELVRLAGHPIVILIDDLDRCQFEYVAKLLQGIQTLFWRAPVAYVVAADRQWLRGSYETQYGPYRDYVGEVGRPLGYLFLEKLFQLSANVPRLDVSSAQQYWRKLLRVAPDDRRAQVDQARGRAQAQLQQAATEAEVLAATRDAAASGDDAFAQAMREEAIVRLASQEIEAHNQHVLGPFLAFLEPNPRAMKRMVNAYGVRRAVDVLRGGQTDRGVLALWTILEMRWPILAEHLAEHPDEVEEIRFGRSAKVEANKDLLLLYQSPEVWRLLNGDAPEVHARLDAATIRQCTGSMGSGAGEVMA